MSAAEQPTETQYHKPERGRLTAIGRRTGDGSHSTLLVIHEVDGSWSFHGLGAPGVQYIAFSVNAKPFIVSRLKRITSPSIYGMNVEPLKLELITWRNNKFRIPGFGRGVADPSVRQTWAKENRATTFISD